MTDQRQPPTSTPDLPAKSRGRGKSRGGLGKYLRARGRGRGGGRPAEFGKRLVLEDEEEVEVDPNSEEAKEFQQKYSRRELGSNADRYTELEPELNSDGEVEQEPEVDLSSFLAKQRLSPDTISSPVHDDDDDVDISLAHISSRPQPKAQSKKGQVQHIEWDEQLDELSREKAAAEAARDLKTRFRAKSDRIRVKPIVEGEGIGRDRKQGHSYVEAPPLPIDPNEPEKDAKAEMEDFLDDLLS